MSLWRRPAPQIANVQESSALAQMEWALKELLATRTIPSSARIVTAIITCQARGVCSAEHVNPGKKKVKLVRVPRIANVWPRHRMSTSGSLVGGAVVPKIVEMVSRLGMSTAKELPLQNNHQLGTLGTPGAQARQMEEVLKPTLKINSISTGVACRPTE